MKITSLLLPILLLVSCEEEKHNQEISSNGIWQQLGYGKIIQINNDSLKIYDICKVG